MRARKVKENSIEKYLNELKCIDKQIVINDNDSISGRNSINVYELFKDSFNVLKNKGVSIGDKVEFTLSDKAYKSRGELINTYLYEAIEYDDVSITMKLIDFKVEHINNTILP